MNVTAEAYGVKLANNSVTKALYDGEWGVRLTFYAGDDTSKYDVTLTAEEAKALITKIQQSLISIKDVKKLQGV